MNKILLLSANPLDTTQLRVNEEMREIKEGLKRSKHREDFVVETGQDVRYRDIRRAILDFEPNIVHFSGHGDGEEGLIFEDETGESKLVKAEALARLFELFADEIECVVLNACYSQIQAKAIARHISYVVGMNKAIGDQAALEFAVGFYDGLGAGKSVTFAYKLGCNSIEIAGIPQHLTPQLLSNSDIQDKETKNNYNAASPQPRIPIEHDQEDDEKAIEIDNKQGKARYQFRSQEINLDNDKNKKYSEQPNQKKQADVSAKDNHELSHLFLSLCQQKLALYIGPMANMIVEDTLTEFPHLSSQQFIQTLALEISNPQESQEFINKLLSEINQSRDM